MLSKLLSGRYVLTMAAGYVFIHLSVTGWIKPGEAMQLITMVFVLYFQKNRGSDAKTN